MQADRPSWLAGHIHIAAAAVEVVAAAAGSPGAQLAEAVAGHTSVAGVVGGERSGWWLC